MSADIVERLRQERQPTRWARGMDCDYPVAWEPHKLCAEAANEITLLRTALAERAAAPDAKLRADIADLAQQCRNEAAKPGLYTCYTEQATYIAGRLEAMLAASPQPPAERAAVPAPTERPLTAAAVVDTPSRAVTLGAAVPAQVVEASKWQALYRRAVNEANGLTNYVEDRPELRRAERNLAAIEAEARALTARPAAAPESAQAVPEPSEADKMSAALDDAFRAGKEYMRRQLEGRDKVLAAERDVYRDQYNLLLKAVANGVAMQPPPPMIFATHPAPARVAVALTQQAVRDIANGLNGVQPPLGQWSRDLRLADAVIAEFCRLNNFSAPVQIEEGAG